MRAMKGTIIGTTGAVFALLLVASPLTSATSVTFGPPYTGGQKIISGAVGGNSIWKSGCSGSHSASTTGHAYLTSGVVHANASAHVFISCSPCYNYNPFGRTACAESAWATEEVGFQSPNFSVVASGNHNVTIHWILDWSGSGNFLSAVVVGWVEDLTNGSVVSLGSTGSLPTGEKLMANLSAMATMVPGDVYALITWVALTLSIGVHFLVGQSGTQSGSGSLDMAGGGEHGKLVSLSVS